MNSIEIKDLAHNLDKLIGYKSIYRIDLTAKPTENLTTKTIQYRQKYNINNKLKINTYNYFYYGTYDIESLKITYSTGKRSFNLRRNKNKSITTVIVIPITLLTKDQISKMIYNIHGFKIDSIEFISMLKISQVLEDDIQYVREINILGFTFYQHLRIDCLQKCIATNHGINLHEITRIKTRNYAKVPSFTKPDELRQIGIVPKSISFETFDIE